MIAKNVSQTFQISFHNHGAKKKRKGTNFDKIYLQEEMMQAKHRGEKIMFYKRF